MRLVRAPPAALLGRAVGLGEARVDPLPGGPHRLGQRRLVLGGSRLHEAAHAPEVRLQLGPGPAAWPVGVVLGPAERVDEVVELARAAEALAARQQLLLVGVEWVVLFFFLWAGNGGFLYSVCTKFDLLLDV